MSPIATYLPAVLVVASQSVLLHAHESVSNTNPWIQKLSSQPQNNCVPHKEYATCTVKPDPAAPFKVTGTVDFSQIDFCGHYGDLLIKVTLKGFPISDPVKEHGMHVHQYGDLSNGCTSTGGHYNPFNMTHGAPFDEKRHVGDFGNIPVQAGQVKQYRREWMADIYGRYSILGRAIVIHAGTDDLGKGGNPSSKVNGNAGARLACCVIGRGKDWYAADQQ